MRINFAIAAGALALGLATWITPVTNAQGPMYDRVNVSLPYTVTIGDHTLQPGDYVIQQLGSQSGSRVLLIYSDKGMKFETSAMTIPAVEVNTPESTKIVLHRFGSDYYFDKIWIQGKDYGYEFPLPNSVKQRESERMQAVSVPANYQAVPDTTTATTTSAETSVTPAPVTPEPVTPEPAATATQTTPPAAEPQPMVDANQNASSASTAPAPMAPSTMDNNSADRSMDNSGSGNAGNTGRSDRSMPNTSAGWLMMLLSGGTLSGAGLMLRRKR